MEFCLRSTSRRPLNTPASSSSSLATISINTDVSIVNSRENIVPAEQLHTLIKTIPNLWHHMKLEWLRQYKIASAMSDSRRFW